MLFSYMHSIIFTQQVYNNNALKVFVVFCSSKFISTYSYRLCSVKKLYSYMLIFSGNKIHFCLWSIYEERYLTVSEYTIARQYLNIWINHFDGYLSIDIIENYNNHIGNNTNLMLYFSNKHTKSWTISCQICR